ncbi:MAG: YbjN domain-containing protein [Gammaproteobacteria bacterium]|nr:YbjN domain-containing protein [Gammaproteobacteria bacterium]
MVSREDIEGFLIRMDLDYEEVDEGMFLAHGDNGGAGVVVHHSDPVLVLRLKMMDLPAEPEDELTGLYRTLLELNATDIVHGAYGIEEGELILTDTLELENLDFTELQASIESLQLAASSHMGRIRELAQAGSVPQAMEG